MYLRSLKRLIATLFLPLLALTGFAQTVGNEASQGLQIEFPAGGQLRIENDLGSVTAETWSQKYVHVTARGEAGSSRLSSGGIENGNQGFGFCGRGRPGNPGRIFEL